MAFGVTVDEDDRYRRVPASLEGMLAPLVPAQRSL
jgi:hypothetical protein